MRHLIFAVCLSLGVLLTHAAPASACINDRETARVERDFKANYEFKSGYQVQDPAPQSSAEEGWGPVTATGSGILLMLAAAGLVTFNMRRFR